MQLDLQYAVDQEKYELPDAAVLQRWVKTILDDYSVKSEVTIRIVDEDEMTALNSRFRHSSTSTNVLSFPFETPKGVDIQLLGDIIICPAVVEQEAHMQNKSIEAHWAHMVTHGLLHLLGYDHIESDQAKKMEEIEINLLQQLGFSNPYEVMTNQ